MMNPIVAVVVATFIKVVLGSDLFSRIEASVKRWADKEIAGAKKREGVMAEMQVIGIEAAEWTVRIAIDLAVGKMRNFETK
jgi:hypothetical protein